MTFGQAVTSVIHQYATGTGRASRSEFWWWYLAYCIILLVATFFDLAIDDSCTALRSIVSLGFALPNLCVGIRRCHDSNHSGWWILCPIMNIVLLFYPSDPCVNEYGAPEGFGGEKAC